ncbi:MAG: host attachment family protein [Bauldia sp.]
MAEVRIPQGAIVFVGDGEKALVLRNRGSEAHPDLAIDRVVLGVETLAAPADQDRESRRLDALGPKTAVLEEADWFRFDKHRFAKDIATMLYRAAHAGGYESLVIVAPPRTLGELRAELHSEVRSRLIAEIDKDLTGHPIASIERILGEG